MSQAFDPQTLDYYSGSAAAYLKTRPNTANPHLEPFLKRLPAGAHVLDLGCGAGQDTAAMLKAGYKVDAVDGTPEIAAITSEHLGHDVRVMRFNELDADGVYDGVWACATLHHVPFAALPDVLSRIYRALKPGGIHFANYKRGSGEGRDDKSRYYCYLSLDDLISTYEAAASWTVLDAEALDGEKGYKNSQADWVQITVQK